MSALVALTDEELAIALEDARAAVLEASEYLTALFQEVERRHDAREHNARQGFSWPRDDTGQEVADGEAKD